MGPVIVYVFPDPVCPYANVVHAYPSTAISIICLIPHFSSTSPCVVSWSKTALNVKVLDFSGVSNYTRNICGKIRTSFQVNYSIHFGVFLKFRLLFLYSCTITVHFSFWAVRSVFTKPIIKIQFALQEHNTSVYLEAKFH